MWWWCIRLKMNLNIWQFHNFNLRAPSLRNRIPIHLYIVIGAHIIVCMYSLLVVVSVKVHFLFESMLFVAHAKYIQFKVISVRASSTYHVYTGFSDSKASNTLRNLPEVFRQPFHHHKNNIMNFRMI